MIQKEPSLRTIIKINLRFALAALTLFYGWLCWQWTSLEWWGFGLIAVLCLVGGGASMVVTSFNVIKIVMRRREVETFKRQGGSARADRIARENDLKRQGMIR